MSFNCQVGKTMAGTFQGRGHMLAGAGNLNPDCMLLGGVKEQARVRLRKGARAFVAIERRRLARNVELSAWLERFPVANPEARWPVYLTDPAKTLPGAEARWRAFRTREKNGTLPGARGVSATSLAR